MDDAQQLLFGKFPRAVGVTTPRYEDMELRQYLVHSEKEFDGVVSKVEGKRNLYSSLSAYQPVRVDGEFEGCAVVADKVSFDFDSSAKLSDKEKSQYGEDEETPNWSHPLIDEFANDAEVVRQMHEDPEICEAVLDDVCYGVRQLAQACIEDDIPIIGVFSGFGIHVHQLREVTKSRPGDKMLSTCNRQVAELNLSCADERASGRPFRIMRIPNCERVCHESETGTGLYTVPLRAAELAEITPEQLMDLSSSPRAKIGSEPNSRPPMKVHEDYLGPGYDEGVGQEKMRPVPEQSEADDFYVELIKDIVQMPCVYERAIGTNPPNDVRVKLGIMLLNADYSVSEAVDLIAKLGWVDFSREVTRYQLKNLKKSGKGDWSCKTMMSKGLCVRADNPQDCDTYMYQGGNKPW